MITTQNKRILEFIQYVMDTMKTILLLLMACIAVAHSAFAQVAVVNQALDRQVACGVCATPAHSRSLWGVAPMTANTQRTTGSKKVLYIRVVFPDRQSEPISLAEARSTMAMVNDFYVKQAYGKIALTTTFTDSIMMPSNRASYYIDNGNNQYTWYPMTFVGQAEHIAQEKGWDSDDYDFSIVRVDMSPINFPSQAWIGRSGAVIVHAVPAITAHELGHNLGLYHAQQWSSSGELIEYGNPYDIMGGYQDADMQKGDISASAKAYLGWLPAVASRSGTQPGTYRLWHLDVATLQTNGIYNLYVTNGSGDCYCVELRKNLRNDPQATGGVLVYKNEDPLSSKSRLVDAMPSNTVDSLLVGASLPCDQSDLVITPLQLATDWADISITKKVSHPGRFYVVSAGNMDDGAKAFLIANAQPNRQYTLQTSENMQHWVNVESKTSQYDTVPFIFNLSSTGIGFIRAFQK